MTKIQIIFDASCKTMSEKSLNDLLLVRPNIQENLHEDSTLLLFSSKDIQEDIIEERIND